MQKPAKTDAEWFAGIIVSYVMICQNFCTEIKLYNTLNVGNCMVCG